MAFKKEKNMYLCQSFNQNMLVENIPFKEDLMDKKNKNNIAKILLAFGVLASPMMLANQVSADNSIANTTNTSNVDATATAQSDAVTTENVIKENKENQKEEEKTQPEATTTDETEAEATEETTTTENTATDETEATSQKEEASEEKEEAVVEDKEAFTLTEAQKQALKQAGFTDAEIEGIEKEIALELEADPNFDTDSFLKEIIAQKASELEMSEEAKPEPVAAGEKKITDIQGTIDGNIKSGITKVKPLAQDAGEDYDTILKTAFSFGVPDSITGGDTFEVKVSDNVNLHGISKDPEIDDLYYNGELLAKAEVQADGRKIIYRFTNYVDKIANIKMNISFPLFIDKVNVPENSTENVVVTVDGNEFSKTFDVDYTRDSYYKNKDEKEDVETLSGKANLDTVTDKSYHHTIYVNTNNQELTNSKLRIRNQDNTDGAIFDQGVLDSVKVYRLNDGKQLKDSFNLDYNDLTDVTDQATVRKALEEKMGILVDINQKNDKASYVVVYDGKRKENTSLNTIVDFAAAKKKRMDGTPEGSIAFADKNWSWKNDVHFDRGDGSATGEEKIYKLGDKVWIDENGNGIQDTGEKPLKDVYVSIVVGGQEIILRTDENGNYTFNNLPNGEYEVTFANLQGYKPTKAKQGTDDTVDSDAKLVDGVLKTTAKIQDADNMNVDLGVIKEKTYTIGDRVWIDADKNGIQDDGEVGLAGVTVKLTGEGIDEKTATTDKNGSYKFEGLTNGNYKVTFETPEGYTITKTGQGGDVTKDSDGNSVDVTIKDADNLSIDFGLIKETSGSFVEHHIYEEYKDGKLVNKTKIDIPVVKGSEDQTFETSAKPNGTADDPKAGFTLVKDRITKSAEITENITGDSVTRNFIDGKDLEVTYVYRKDTTSEKGTFQEHHIYQTVDEEGNVISTDFENHKDVKTGNVGEEYKTSKIDQPTYELKEVKTENGAKANKDGSEATGKFVKDKKQEVTYIYKRVQKNGSFQEHHKYITKDQDGKIIETKTDDGETTKGNEKQSYTTGKVEKDDFEFKRIENPIGGPIYSGDGA